MALSWVFAIIFLLAAFLGIGQASSSTFCGDGRTSQCVEPRFCGPQSEVQFRRIECPGYQVCCRVDEINNLAANELDEFS